MGKGANLLYIQANCQGYSDETQVTDYWYYSHAEYQTNDYTSINIELPTIFKLEFDITPTTRSTSGWGSGSYLRVGTNDNTGIWIGQLTSGGRHGIMPKPSGTTQYCQSDTVLNADNHIILTYNGTTAVYTCNNESVTVNVSNLTKLVTVASTINNHLKNIKVTKL